MNDPTTASSVVRLSTARFFAFSLLFAAPAGAQTPTRYTITNLGNLGGTNVDPRAINASGTIVGEHRTTIFVSSSQAFSHAGTVMTPLPALLGSALHSANGINAAGTIVGTANPLTSPSRGFIISGGVVSDIGSLAGGRTQANAINNAGVVVGGSHVGDNQHAFSYTAGVWRDLGTLGGDRSAANAINSSGVIVGDSVSGGEGAGIRGFIYSGGVMTGIPTLGGIYSYAYAINDAGTVVGQSSVDATSPPTLRAYIYANGVMTGLRGLSGNFTLDVSSANGINSAGTVVGTASDPSGVARAFVYTTATGMVDLHTLVNLAGSGFTRLDTATGINDSGQIVGYGVLANGGQGGFRLDPVITPSTAGRLINLSILTSLADGADSFTMGYVVGGAGTTGPKPLLIRAAGPSLTPLGVGGALADPQLILFAGATQTGANDNWGGGTPLADAMTAVGAFAFTGPASRDAAALANIAAGDNSVKVSPVGNISGTVIAEIYDATPAASFTATTPRLINVSVLKNLGTGLTAGFVIGGTASRTVLIRAIGPTLGAAPFGVPGVVADPQLTLFSGATQIGANDNWSGTPALTAAFTSVGAFALPATSRDAAVLVTLAPGNYSVQVSGVANTTGTALVEVYEVP